eukprot:TRINITY_DN705_c0_g2_i2.p1 TRINITY_DN705_c0_g2~~TRINITY_DN705_c0_g2_i2.p1  ORF type:complete len:402 (-),score=89.97 TRINITY_DN705_c0_g2_i2:110-1315(-)
MSNLDYFKGMGFDAIWISPVVLNYQGAYHGYAALDFFSINPNFGTEQDLINLVDACHAKDIWVMVDIVGNHVAPVGFDYSKISPFNQSEHYHDYCEINDDDWDHNQTRVENCRIFNLPDLNQSNPFVREGLKNWVKWLINTFHVDGLRIDTVPEVQKDFWADFSTASGVYTVGEVFNGRYDYVAGYQGALSGTLNYPGYFNLKGIFQYGNSMYNFRAHYTNMNLFKDQGLLGNFADNHDNPRFLNGTSNIARYQNALNFVLSSVGIPIVYYGSEQGFSGGNDPGCREPLWGHMNTSSPLYQFLKTIISYRQQLKWWQYPQVERYADDNFYAFTRGEVLMAFTNSDNEVRRTITYHPYAEGTRLCNIFYPGDCVKVTNGSFDVFLEHGETKTFIVNGTHVVQ